MIMEIHHLHDHNYTKNSKVPTKERKDVTKGVVKRKAEPSQSSQVIHSSFFLENGNLILKKITQEMKSAISENVSEEFKGCVIDIAEFPERVTFSEDIYMFLDIFSEKNVSDRPTFIHSIHKLMSNDKFTDAMEIVFKDIKGFLSMSEMERYQFVQCFNRRFLNEALVRKVEIECSLLPKKSNLVRPYPLMSIKDSLEKEENVVHHIGGYIAHELILQYGNDARLFVRNSITTPANASEETENYSKWTQLLSNGRLIKLKPKAFNFIFKLNVLSKVNFQKGNATMKYRLAKAFKDLESNDFLEKTWLELWGDGKVSQAAKKKAYQIFLNCLGKGYVGKIKTNVQIDKKASLKSSSLRKQMKNQKACDKCKDVPNENKVKVPRVKKTKKGFLAP